MRSREVMSAAWELLTKTPGEGIVHEYPTLLMFPLRIYTRCRSLFHAADILIQNQLPEEAMILGRSLFEESLWLGAFAAASGPKRDALILGWTFKSYADEKQLMASPLVEESVSGRREILAALDRDVVKLQNRQRKLGIEKAINMPDTKTLASRQSRLDDYWDYLYAHRLTHGTVPAHRGRTRKLAQPDTIGLFLKTGDPQTISGAIGFTVTAVLHAHRSACVLFGWPQSDRISELLDETEALAARLEAGATD